MEYKAILKLTHNTQLIQFVSAWEEFLNILHFNGMGQSTFCSSENWGSLVYLLRLQD